MAFASCLSTQCPHNALKERSADGHVFFKYLRAVLESHFVIRYLLFYGLTRGVTRMAPGLTQMAPNGAKIGLDDTTHPPLRGPLQGGDVVCRQSFAYDPLLRRGARRAGWVRSPKNLNLAPFSALLLPTASASNLPEG